MNRNNVAFDPDSILDQLADSDLGEDFEDDEDDWHPPGELPSSSSEDEDEQARRPIVATPASANRWTQRRFVGRMPMPSLVNEPAEELLTPSEYFGRYFTEDIYELFALNTNIYYQSTYNKQLNSPVATTEIKKFFGINGILGCIKYPRIKMAWNLRFRLSCISEAMARERFFLIRTNIHIVDKGSVSAEAKSLNKLWLVQPLIDAVRGRCLQIPRDQSHYSIDEQMVPFLGKCPIRQFVKNKPRPVGLKNYVMTSSKGLVLDFELHQGPTTPLPDRALGLGPSIVLRLINTLPRGSFVYFDRYFTTIPLLEKMVTLGIEGTGTIIANRFKGYQFPKDAQMNRGDYHEIVNHRRDLCVIKWKDSKTVLIGSTAIGAQPVHKVQRYDKTSKSYIEVTCPDMIKKYNEYMGGVDVCDQMMEAYRSWHKTRKWPVKTIMHLFDMAMVNSWYEYRQACERKNVRKADVMDFLDFKICVSDFLLGGPTRKRTREDCEEIAEMPATSQYQPAPIPTVDKRCDGYNHWPICDSLRAPRCCRMVGCTSRSKVRCTKCNVYLCSTKDKHCFYAFHNEK